MDIHMTIGANWTAGINITEKDIEKLKKAAKRAKRAQPGTTHTQQLDLMAREIYGAPHYHALVLLLKRQTNAAIAAQDNHFPEAGNLAQR